MKNLKSTAAILLALALCFTVAACGGGGESTATSSAAPPSSSDAAPPSSTAPPSTDSAQPEGTLQTGEVIEAPKDAEFADRIDISTELNVSLLDPQSTGSTFAACRIVFQMVYDRLTNFTENQELVPELATSWETDDQQTWIFHLRDDVYFHNGDKFTAQDVINTWQGAKEAPGSLAWDQWLPIEAIDALDEYTVEIVLNAPYSSFAYNMSLPGAAIINKAAREADPVEGLWVGTGAYYVSDFVSGNTTTLTRNDNYWGQTPITKVVNFTYVPEVAARTIMQLNDEINVSLSIGPTDNDMFNEDPNFIVYGYAANSTVSLTFSMLDPITGDLNFRLAVAHALNREEIAYATTGNWARATKDGAFWGDSTPYRNTSIPRLEQDLDLAKQYLADSVYNGEEIELISGPDTLTLGAQVIQEQLRVIGINVRVNLTDVATLVGLTQYGDENMQMLHFVSPFELNPSSARVMLYPGMSANRASYNNPEVNELLDKVITIGDPAEQELIYHRIQEIVSQEIPQLSLYERIWTIVTNNRVGGIKINPDMNHDFRGIFMTVD